MMVLLGETPITKNEATLYIHRPEVSVIKTIKVVDTQGNQYEATYPKRAKGLVKKGRARFVDETTICLARPPYHTEDEIMEENETILTTPESEAAQFDAAYVIAKIEQIMADSETRKRSLELLASDRLDEFGNTALAIGNMIEARERTNQEMIGLLKRIVAEKL